MCRFKTSFSSLTDQNTLKLGKGSKDMEDQLARTAGGVDIFLQTAKADASSALHFVIHVDLVDGIGVWERLLTSAQQ